MKLAYEPVSIQTYIREYNEGGWNLTSDHRGDGYTLYQRSAGDRDPGKCATFPPIGHWIYYARAYATLLLTVTAAVKYRNVFIDVPSVISSFSSCSFTWYYPVLTARPQQ